MDFTYLLLTLFIAISEDTCFRAEYIQKYVRSICDHTGVSTKDFTKDLRLKLTGQKVGIGLFDIMEILGRQECLKRI